ncbi:MAG: DUF5615 family PIN-like protein [Phycisphaerales bacterium]
MNLRRLTFLADENIHPRVIEWMRSQSITIQSVHEVGLGGTDDLTIIRHAAASSQVVLTHDSDFGTLAIAGLEPIFGIVYLRPGHIKPEFTLATLRTLFDMDMDVQPGFLMVAHRHGTGLRVRIRTVTIES